MNISITYAKIWIAQWIIYLSSMQKMYVNWYSIYPSSMQTVCIDEWIMHMAPSFIQKVMHRSMSNTYGFICVQCKTIYWSMNYWNRSIHHLCKNYAFALCSRQKLCICATQIYAIALCNRQTESRDGKLLRPTKLSNNPSAKTLWSTFWSCRHAYQFEVPSLFTGADAHNQSWGKDFYMHWTSIGSTGCDFTNKIHVPCCFLKHVLYSTEYRVPCIQYIVPSTVYKVHSTQYCVYSTWYCVQSI